MNSYLILYFVLMTCLNCSVKSKEFCQSFKDNQNRISYTFMYTNEIIGQEDMAFIDIIIGSNYWRLKTNREHINLKFVDQNHQSKPTGPFFAGDYSIAFHACCCQIKYPIRNNPWSIGCRTFLINPNTWNVSIGVEDPSSPVSMPESFRKENQVHLKYMTGKRMSAFAIDFYDNEFEKVVFVDYDRGQGKLNTIGFSINHFYESLKNPSFVPHSRELDRYPKMKLLNMQIGKFNLLSVINIFLKGNLDGWRFVLIWEKDQQLRWCSNHHKLNISNECDPGFLLIDCKNNTVPNSANTILFNTTKALTIPSELSSIQSTVQTRHSRQTGNSGHSGQSQQTTNSMLPNITTLSTLKTSETESAQTLTTISIEYQSTESQTSSLKTTDVPTLDSDLGTISEEYQTNPTESDQINGYKDGTVWTILGIIMFCLVAVVIIIALLIAAFIRQRPDEYKANDKSPDYLLT